MSKLKILMLNQEYPPIGGGASTVTGELCKQLVQRGHQVDMVTMRYGDLPAFETVDGVNIYRTPAIRKEANICHTYELATFPVGALIKTISLAKQQRYDIIHCHFIVPGGPLAWVVSKITKIPFLITCHGTDIPGHNPDRFGLVHKLVKPVWRLLAKNASILTAPTNALGELILENCPKAKVRVIGNGINTDKFVSAEKTESILMCSRIFNFKGFQYAIEAVKDTELSWQVNIVGEGPFLPELKRLAQGSKTKIKFWGWLDKNDPRFHQLYNESAIFIFPSEAESFGMVIAEAMAAGNAIIASDIPAHREVLADSGLFVPPRNAEEIRVQLQRLIDDENLRNELADKAASRVRECFDWKVITEKFIDCYKEVLSKTN